MCGSTQNPTDLGPGQPAVWPVLECEGLLNSKTLEMPFNVNASVMWVVSASQCISSAADAVFLPTGIVALWSLALLAFERYIVICRPLGNVRLRGRHAALGIAFVWVFSFLWTIPPTVGWSSYTTSKIGTTCEPNW